MGLVRTNKFLDTSAVERLHKMAVAAATTPALVVTQRHLGPHGKDEATLAQERFHAALDSAATGIGFPVPALDIYGHATHYGLDFKTGEILEWDGQT